MPGTHKQDVAPVVSRGQSLGNDRSGPQADGAEIETLRVVTGEEPPLLEQRKETVNEPVGVDTLVEIVSSPDGSFTPVHPGKLPDAVQLLALVDDQLMVKASPWLKEFGVTLRVGADGGACADTLTVIALSTELGGSPHATMAWYAPAAADPLTTAVVGPSVPISTAGQPGKSPSARQGSSLVEAH